jgi:hypothetical protein
MRLILLFLIAYFSFCSQNFSQQQNPFIYTCRANQNITNNILGDPTFGGYLKPERTDYSGVPADAYFPVLIVFVQFANDLGPQVDYWPRGNAPVYIDSLIAPVKKYLQNGDWWDTYFEATETLSDYWLEQSRGHLHIVGRAISIILDHEYQYYQNNGGIHRVNDEIYQKLNALGTIDWRDYDKWKAVTTETGYSFVYQPDGYVDMIYKILRSHAPLIDLPCGGIATLDYSESQGDNYLIDPVHQIYINGGSTSIYGSGITLTPSYSGTEGGADYSPYAALTKNAVVSFSGHEHGHYLFGCGHSNYGKMCGTGAPYGVDEALSPWESIKMNYMQPVAVDYNNPYYSIGDFSSRDNNITGQVLQVPINGSDEFFLIASRRKVSRYDKIMWGDTARGEPYRIINQDYGKGVYIYHTPSGYNYPPNMDQECADGLYTWQFQGYQYPDWSNEQEVEYYIRTGVSYDNDLSGGSLQCADGKSVITWFGLGKKNPVLNTDGTDRVFTNRSEVWTSREFQGDRWDAWNVGYNEIFSPYSSPNTKTWGNNYSGVFIWYDSLNPVTNTAMFRIYKAGQGGLSENDILALTPPSRPMGLKVELTNCVNSYAYPKVTWLHNMEPDMLRSGNVKRYRIYRTQPVDSSIVPLNYSPLNVTDFDAGSMPQFIDYSIPVACTYFDGNTNILNVRYQVTAIDNSDKESVRSDFASLAYSSIVTGTHSQNRSTPYEYRLYQNYPNPFNSVTEIKFDLPVSGNVVIKVYDILGGLVSTAVNGYKTAGTYSIMFSGANLASGIYIYRIETSGFIDAKRMVLVK